MLAHERSLLRDEELILQLAQLSEIDYDRTRKEKAKEMGLSQEVLDKAVKKVRKNNICQSDDIFPKVEPWEEAVELQCLLDEVVEALNGFMIFPTAHEPRAIALWIIHTYCLEEFDISPILHITSPEKRCGKSTLLELLQILVYRPLIASNITPAAMFRSVEKWNPTLIIDEADTFMRDNEELRGIINSGHKRSGAYVIRCIGENHEPTRFCTWCPKIIAGIGKLAETIEDRSVIIELRRKLSVEKKTSLNDATKIKLHELARKCVKFINDKFSFIKNELILEIELNDRAADNWGPLMIIAKAASQEWLHYAHSAALHLSGNKQETISVNVELLIDIKNIFDDINSDRISTNELLNKLCEDDEAPWVTYNHGKPLAPRQLANKLKEFGIISSTIRLSSIDTKKGYLHKNFLDAFERYLPSSSSEISITSVTATQPSICLDSIMKPQTSQIELLQAKNALEAFQNKRCDGVTDKSVSIKPVRENRIRIEL